MSRRAAASRRFLPESLARLLRRSGVRAFGLSVIAATGAAAAAFATHHPGDPSWNSASNAPVRNLLGWAGATFADLLFQGIGIGAWALAFVLFAWGVRWLILRPATQLPLRLAALVLGLLPLCLALTYLPWREHAPVAAGWGGAAGALLRLHLDPLMQAPLPPWVAPIATWGLGVPLALSLFAFASAVDPRLWGFLAWLVLIVARVPFSLFARRPAAPPAPAPRARSRRDPSFAPAPRPRDGSRLEPSLEAAPDEETEDETDEAPIVDRPAAPANPEERERSRQGRLALGRRKSGLFELPPLDLLAAPKLGAQPKTTDEGLTQNARLLESVLAEFGVNGEIVKIRPGPVVTLYELEPAPGTKTARVVGLADDIARSMSAVSARIAAIPGRNVIGIELPNARRETVYLRELLTADAFVKSQQALCLGLGKDIGGGAEYVDLARMPHLLIAGTTGSGKSVAINTMILSLLYRLTPEQCRLIMIDPKMLELSVYDGIPHLLAPVVTDPGKAVVALKWAVREMEDRYRAMSQVGVRNIQGYNQKLAQAREKGETLTRTVQTGFDAETGEPIYEEQELALKALPNIVVVVDEMADLMLVAGKDVEGAIQRLAQMARAAGIHLIMATQRPSVDVITGTIKANFPTRISFQVTSKIDSRTILGEQGAEQLLGQGDMLYMAAGGRITRVHGPFVSDQEVEDVVAFLRAQGEPEYLNDVTIDPEAEFGDDPDGDPEAEDPLYDQAVAIVLRERKASTSFIQRHLQIGYNRAARIVEAMERAGLVGPANHVGKREILGGGSE
jgi:S-DNA-T family DNA segregation ATPase FtsK/SpoIIIE